VKPRAADPAVRQPVVAYQRRYSRDTLRRVAFIRASQQVGISLAVIREAVDHLPSERTSTRDDWARLSVASSGRQTNVARPD
jgi:DNA-binding transcriptional MerR regulator